jgi:hypothetical protein
MADKSPRYPRGLCCGGQGGLGWRRFGARANPTGLQAQAQCLLSLTGLWLALLRRWLGLFLPTSPPARFVRGREQTERTLAQAIRATLIAHGETFPDVSDAALLAWFARHHPCSDKTAMAAGQHFGHVAYPHFSTSMPLDRRLPAGKVDAKALAGWKPALHHARAPPKLCAKSNTSSPPRAAARGRRRSAFMLRCNLRY